VYISMYLIKGPCGCHDYVCYGSTIIMLRKEGRRRRMGGGIVGSEE